MDIDKASTEALEITDCIRNKDNLIIELRKERAQYAQDVLTLIKQLRYCVGIAERGFGMKCPEEQSGESFLLEYVKSVEQERDELAAQVEVMTTALDSCAARCFPEDPLMAEINEALSINPSAALREIKARTLEEAAQYIKDTAFEIYGTAFPEYNEVAHWLEDLVEAERKGE